VTTVGKARASIVGAQAAKAVSVLKESGWIVGPPTDPEGWRSALRAEARRADVRIRTGAARRVDGEFPWAVTTEFPCEGTMTDETPTLT
jgi:hypothetical protein